MRILIVDDEYISRQVLFEMLKAYGQCDMVSNGKDALDAFKLALDSNDPYSLICLDIMLPEMDGHEVLKKIREIEKENNILEFKGVKIIMVSALDDSDSIKKAFIEQCEAYLIKPFTKENIISLLKDLKLIK